jgi:cell division protein FtsN
MAAKARHDTTTRRDSSGFCFGGGVWLWPLHWRWPSTSPRYRSRLSARHWAATRPRTSTNSRKTRTGTPTRHCTARTRSNLTVRRRRSFLACRPARPRRQPKPVAAKAAAKPRTKRQHPGQRVQTRGDRRPAGRPGQSPRPRHPKEPQAAAAKAPDPFTYFVQVGAFRTADDAETQRAKLSLAGIETKVSERQQAGSLVHRVRVGPFDTREAAEKSRNQLNASGIEAALVRVQN